MLRNYIPAIDWLKNYNRSDLKGDITAGIIVAIMLIPQGMAYAMLAGLPPVIGLYASTIPLIVYALLGSSRQLAVGPVAMVSLLVFSGVSPFAEPGSNQYVSYVLLLALMVGILQLGLGLLRLGLIVNFLSHAVISGFTSAAAIIIGLSQLKNLLGTNIEKGNVFEILYNALLNVSDTNLYTFGIGLVSIIILVLFKKYVPKIPGPLVVVVTSSIIVYYFELYEKGVSIVGEVPSGIPTFSLPAFDWNSITALLPVALTITFVGFMESVAVAKAIAAKEGYKINANQELNGLGTANIVGSFFSAFPVTGGFSRSAVNYQSGARTGLASIITASLIILTLLFFTGWFYYLPQSVLAAIIMVAVVGLIDVKEAVHLFKIKKVDGWTLLITFVATLTISIEVGIVVGIVFSLLVFIWRSAYPHMAELGYIQDKNIYRNIERYPDATTHDKIILYRIDASLYFANIGFFEEQLNKLIEEKRQTKKIVLDFSSVNDLDAIAIDELERIMHEYDQRGIDIVIVQMKGPVRDLVKKAGWYNKYSKRINYYSIQHFLEKFEKET